MTEQPETGNPETETVEEQAKEHGKREPTGTSFAKWLETQPDDVRQMYGEHTAGLTSALDKERNQRKEQERQLKRLAELEAQEQKRREADMSELEKAQQKAAQLEGELKTLRKTEMQRQAADKAGLPAVMAVRLQGETPEELEADAKQLAEALPKQIKTPPGIPATNPGNVTGKGETDAEKRRRLGLG